MIEIDPFLTRPGPDDACEECGTRLAPQSRPACPFCGLCPKCCECPPEEPRR